MSNQDSSRAVSEPGAAGASGQGVAGADGRPVERHFWCPGGEVHGKKWEIEALIASSGQKILNEIDAGASLPYMYAVLENGCVGWWYGRELKFVVLTADEFEVFLAFNAETMPGIRDYSVYHTDYWLPGIPERNRNKMIAASKKLAWLSLGPGFRTWWENKIAQARQIPSPPSPPPTPTSSSCSGYNETAETGGSQPCMRPTVPVFVPEQAQNLRDLPRAEALQRDSGRDSGVMGGPENETAISKATIRDSEEEAREEDAREEQAAAKRLAKRQKRRAAKKAKNKARRKVEWEAANTAAGPVSGKGDHEEDEESDSED